MNAPNRCWVVVVAGSYLDDVQSVLDRIDSLSDVMQMIPYAVFLLGDTVDAHTGYNRHHFSPPLVSMIGYNCIILPISYKIIYRVLPANICAPTA